MKLHLNGVWVELEQPLTILDLLSRHKLKPETVVVEHNFQVPLKDQYSKILLQDDDRVEIVKFMGGG